MKEAARDLPAARKSPLAPHYSGRNTFVIGPFSQPERHLLSPPDWPEILPPVSSRQVAPDSNEPRRPDEAHPLLRPPKQCKNRPRAARLSEPGCETFRRSRASQPGHCSRPRERPAAPGALPPPPAPPALQSGSPALPPGV